MTDQVVTVRRTDPVRQAVRVLHAAEVTGVPVLDEDGHLVGIVSRRDLLTVLARSDENLRADVLAALCEHCSAGPSWEVSVLGGLRPGRRGRAARSLRRVRRPDRRPADPDRPRCHPGQTPRRLEHPRRSGSDQDQAAPNL
ncbi:HPP family protein [Planobispora rosea]